MKKYQVKSIEGLKKFLFDLVRDRLLEFESQEDAAKATKTSQGFVSNFVNRNMQGLKAVGLKKLFVLSDRLDIEITVNASNSKKNKK